MLSERDVLIDEIDIDFVQLITTAVKESNLNEAEKMRVGKTLNRWQNALTLTRRIRVTF